MQWAAWKSHPAIVEAFLLAGAAMEATDDVRGSFSPCPHPLPTPGCIIASVPLCVPAAPCQRLRFVRFAPLAPLTPHVDVSPTGPQDGDSALSSAASAGCLESTEALVAHGANMDIRNNVRAMDEARRSCCLRRNAPA